MLPEERYIEFKPPISIKGIVFEQGKIWLRRNEFHKWELPGGRLEDGEQPELTVVRELREELGLTVTADHLLDATVWYKDYGRNPAILLVTYQCTMVERVGDVEHIGEAGPAEFQAFALTELDALDLPEPYRHAIKLATH